MNEELVQKQKKGRQEKTKKNFGQARVLTVAEALKLKEERKAKEKQAMDEKERKAALSRLSSLYKGGLEGVQDGYRSISVAL